MEIRVKMNISRLLLLLVLFVLFGGCGQRIGNTTLSQNSSIVDSAINSADDNDSLAIVKAFESIITDKIFLKDLAMDGDDHASIFKDQLKIVRGDLDGDGKSDALLSFSVEGRDGGNNADYHYAIFLKRNGQWQYNGQSDMGGSMNDYYITLDSVQNGQVWGMAVPLKNESLVSYRVGYKYSDGDLINTYIELHQVLEDVSEFISVYGFLSADYKKVPAIGSLAKLQKALGKGKITASKIQDDCGALFEESDIRYYENTGFLFEVNDDNEVAFKQVKLKKGGIIVYTDKGTLSADTNLQDVKRCFYEQVTERDEGNKKVLQVFAGEGIDDQLLLYFDRQGKLESIVYFVQC